MSGVSSWRLLYLLCMSRQVSSKAELEDVEVAVVEVEVEEEEVDFEDGEDDVDDVDGDDVDGDDDDVDGMESADDADVDKIQVEDEEDGVINEDDNLLAKVDKLQKNPDCFELVIIELEDSVELVEALVATSELEEAVNVAELKLIFVDAVLEVPSSASNVDALDDSRALDFTAENCEVKSLGYGL